jgi:hypothetical protein
MRARPGVFGECFSHNFVDLDEPVANLLHRFAVEGRWKPDQGGKKLTEAYRAALGAGAAGITSFPIRRPMDATAPRWAAFCRRFLGFVPAATGEDRPAWVDLLRRAYGSAAALSAAWGASHADLSKIPVPAALPPDGAALTDWYRFEGVLSVRRAAHRFAVVLPVPPADTGNAPEYQERRRLAERLVALEKPAHTVFDVRFYCRVPRRRRADRRTPRSTRSRAPELLDPSCWGQPLAEGYLRPACPRTPRTGASRRDPLRRPAEQ